MKTFKILDASKQAGVHVCTLRELEKKGIIHPSRSVAGHRLYSEADLRKIQEHYEKKRSNWITKWGPK